MTAVSTGDNFMTDIIIQWRKDRVQITGKTLGCGSYGKVSLVEYDGTLHWSSSVLNHAGEAERVRLIKDFIRECNLWSTLRHPNIVQFLGVHYPSSDQFSRSALFGVGEDEDEPHFVSQKIQ